MKNNINKLSMDFIDAAEKKHRCLIEHRVEASFKQDTLAEKIYRKIVKKGPAGLAEIKNIAEGESLNAAILICTHAYSIMPHVCTENLERISKINDPMFSLIAGETLRFLKDINSNKEEIRDHGNGCYSMSFSLDDLAGG
ncbi:hypothetical protein ACFL20_07585 [Spirochaetota bacterium]